MKILTVEYSRLKSFGMYENEKIGYVAQVEEGETPEQVLTALKAAVETDLGLYEVRDNIKSEIYVLRADRDQMARETKEMEARFNAAKAFLEKHHISLPQEEIPF